MSDEIQRATREAASLFHSGPSEIPEELARSATDLLSKVAATADEERAEEQKRIDALIASIVYRWDRKMRRTFKGIMASPERYRMLANADRRAERAA